MDMLGIPVVIAVILAGLATSLGLQWSRRRRAYQLAWTVALFWGFVGTLAFVLSAALGGQVFLFRLYYLGGAVLIAPLLGVGSAYLLRTAVWARLLLGITVVSAAVAALGLWTTPLDPARLHAMGIAPGTQLITAPLVIIPVVVGNSLGTIAVVGVALASVWRAVRTRAQSGQAWGNALIAAGTLLVAAAGSLARLGHGAGFWGTMTAGWVVVYFGVTVVSSAHARVHAEQGGPLGQPGSA